MQLHFVRTAHGVMLECQVKHKVLYIAPHNDHCHISRGKIDVLEKRELTVAASPQLMSALVVLCNNTSTDLLLDAAKTVSAKTAEILSLLQ